MALLKTNADSDDKKVSSLEKGGEEEMSVSTIELGLRTEKTNNNKFGWSIVDQIPFDEPCVLYLGGDGTNDDKAANGNAKIIEKDILEPLGITIPVYSIKYNLLQNSASISRGIGFSKYRANSLNDHIDDNRLYNKASADDFNPKYIDVLYHKVIEPRVTAMNGKGKLSVEEACRRMRMMTIVAHCHGGFVALALEKKLISEMNKNGYTIDEQKQILSQMLTITHSPACALGVAKSQMISFVTAADIKWPKSADRTVANNSLNNYLFERQREHKIHCQGILDNNVEKVAKNRVFDLRPCYLPPRHGNMFLIREKCERTQEGMFEVNNAEHNDIGYGYNGKTLEGRLMTYISSNIIKNGIKNSLLQKEKFTPLPKLETLMLGGDQENDTKLLDLWKKMVEGGKTLRKEVCQYAINKLRDKQRIRS